MVWVVDGTRQGIMATLSRSSFIKSAQNSEWAQHVTRYMAILEQEKRDFEIGDVAARMSYEIIERTGKHLAYITGQIGAFKPSSSPPGIKMVRILLA